MCNWAASLPTTSWNPVLHFWVVTVLTGCFYSGYIVGAVWYKWEYNGILFTIRTVELACLSCPSLPVVSARKLVCCYRDSLGCVSKQQEKLYFEEGKTFILWGLRTLSLSTDGKCIKSFNTERKSLKSCIMPSTSCQSLPVIVHFCQDGQNWSLFQGETAGLFLILSALLS